mmetsp:Transcript_16848/g.29506  ORF Transcript_16848/g.29506 Transcript_16848/m.29506 type:complete len:154 (-) Transcript_16848:298-759(-)
MSYQGSEDNTPTLKMIPVETCHNCGRAASIENEPIFDESRVYCGKNCFWSSALDLSNSRLKKRTKPGETSAAARYRRTVGALAEPLSSDGSGSPASQNVDIVQNTNMSSVFIRMNNVFDENAESNAMYDFHFHGNAKTFRTMHLARRLESQIR